MGFNNWGVLMGIPNSLTSLIGRYIIVLENVA